jgi:hypothetical protein
MPRSQDSQARSKASTLSPDPTVRELKSFCQVCLDLEFGFEFCSERIARHCYSIDIRAAGKGGVLIDDLVERSLFLGIKTRNLSSDDLERVVVSIDVNVQIVSEARETARFT